MVFCPVAKAFGLLHTLYSSDVKIRKGSEVEGNKWGLTVCGFIRPSPYSNNCVEKVQVSFFVLFLKKTEEYYSARYAESK